ncbi:MAG: VWA domain-containing protein [Actinomycetia bacterium]|nr:VWA domain-containing protein [Actinomycetes bacterium]
MRSWAIRALLVGMLVVSWLPGLVGNAAAQTSESGGTAFDLCGGDRDVPLAVVLLLDKSGSIKDAAPEQARFIAVDRFTNTLLRVSTETDRDVEINVVLFDTDTETLGWSPLDSEYDLELLSAEIEDGWSDQNVNGDTDQVVAFSTAYDLLEARSASCRVTVMFTDGVIDTVNPGKNPLDLERTEAEACTNLSLDRDQPSLRERAHDFGTNDFVLLLEPKQTGIADFRNRLSHTMTLFTSITGDVNPPTIPDPSGGIGFDPNSTDPDEPGMQCNPKYPQTGLVLSAAHASELEAYFLKLGAELDPNSESGVEMCPQEIDVGTDQLPNGSLISRLQIINFNGGGETLQTDDFEIRQPNGHVEPAGSAFGVVEASDVELQLEVTDSTLLPGGWVLQTVDKTGDGSGYCVEMTASADLTAQLSSDPNPLPIAQSDEVRTVTIVFDPEIDGYEFSFDLNGTRYTTSSSTVEVLFDPEMVTDGVNVSGGSINASNTELFSDIPVDVDTAIKVWNYSLSVLPAAVCENDHITVASGEVPESSTIQSSTGCTVIPGSDSGDLQSFVRIRSTDDVEPEGRVQVAFLGSDGDEITSDWAPFVGAQDVNVRIDGLPNQTVDFEAGYLIEVKYGPTADQASMPDGSESEVAVTIQLDLLARSNGAFATMLTLAVAILAGLLSLLLLWVFNRMTAQLPSAHDFFFYTTKQSDIMRTPVGGSLDQDKLGAARGTGGTLQFGNVGLRLVHPPLWRPLADSIGVIDAPGAAASDPTGPREGTAPVGFASLVIAYRDGGSNSVALVIVVSKSGPRSGIDGVQGILSDRARLDRVERRLPAPPESDSVVGSEDPHPGPSAPSAAPSPPSSRQPKEPSGPTLPGGDGPRLPDSGK